MTLPARDGRRAVLFAHQGGALEAPANTLYAFATAVAGGADALELDVHATADGHLVVLHDATVDATTDGTGSVDALELAAVQALDAAHWWIPGSGARSGRPASAYPLRGAATGDAPAPDGFVPADFRIPTLAEVLERFPGVLINIDIKRTAPETAAYEGELARLLAAAGRGEDTIVASFSAAAMAAFGRFAVPVATAATPSEVADFWTAVNAGTPLPDLRHRHALQVPVTHEGRTVVTPAFVAGAHGRGLAVHVWTIDDPAEAARLLAMGVDGIVSDRPRGLADDLRNDAAAAAD